MSTTLLKPLQMRGVGLHSGREITLRLVPHAIPRGMPRGIACDEIGIVFRRVDLPGAPKISADWREVSHTTHATTLGSGSATVSTTEHLLAALWMSGVTSCVVELDGPEVPILDGSSQGWCELLRGHVAPASGAQNVCGLRQPVYYEQSGAIVFALPHHSLRVSVAVEFGRSYLEEQVFDGIVDYEGFARELAPARTFALKEWIEPLRSQGLIRGASFESAVLLQHDAPSSVLRFPNELARHKALDLLGDLALLLAPQGATLRAHLIAVRAGHASHLGWMRKCVDEDALFDMNSSLEV